MDDKLIHKRVAVAPRAKKDTEGREYYEFEISNEQKDSHGTVFKMAGAKIDDFNSDPIVTYGHPSFDSTDPDDVIGVGPVEIQEGRMIARFYPEDGDSNPKAAKVRAKLEQGIIKSASIVASVDYSKCHVGRTENGEDPDALYFDSYEILAWGVVMKGSNPNAKMRTDQRVMEIRNYVSQHNNRENNDEVLRKLSEIKLRSIIGSAAAHIN